MIGGHRIDMIIMKNDSGTSQKTYKTMVSDTCTRFIGDMYNTYTVKVAPHIKEEDCYLTAYTKPHHIKKNVFKRNF
jgi:hypothetical protein